LELLLDTQAIYWWSREQADLSNRAREAIRDPASRVVVSAASAWELTIKHRKGLWPEVGPLIAVFPQEMAANRFGLVDITVADGLAAGLLDRHHGDPFDRMLIAQALSRGLTLVSSDEVFDKYGVSRLW
jgi:PIN domain nuclease of toxin-antitoxin system